MIHLLTPSILKQIKGYRLLPNRVSAYGFNGQRRSKKSGSSLEFSDFRKYTPGDDVRKIDWNTFARTNKFYIRQYLDEQEVNINVYLDFSKSMTLYSKKWKRSRQLAGIFSFLALQHDDRLKLLILGGLVPKQNRRLKGKRFFTKALHQLESLRDTESGVDPLAPLLKQEALKSKEKTVKIIISDFLEPLPEMFDALENLNKRSQQILLIQVLDKEETEPHFQGDYELIDIETNAPKQVALNRRIVKDYIVRMEEHQKQLEKFSQSRNISFCICMTNESLEENVFSKIKSTGWIQ